MDYKRILKIIAIVLIVIAIIIGAYFLWKWLNSRNTGNLTGTGGVPTTEVTNVGEGGAIGAPINTSEQTTTQTPQTVTQKLSIFIDTPVSEYWLNSKDGSVYFANLAGQIIKINNDNTRQLVSPQTITNLHSIIPSKDGSLAIAEFNYPQLPTFSIFSASSTSWQPLPVSTISATISPDSKKVAYTNEKALNVLDLTTQKTSQLQNMSQAGLNLNWITDQKILFYSDPAIDISGYVYSFDTATKTLKMLTSGDYGTDIKWADKGDLGIKLISAERMPKLSIVDDLCNNLVSLPFVTVPEKCVFSSNSQIIYCGIPKNIRSGIALPDDYYSKNDYFVDDIFEMNLPTGKITKIFDGNDVPLDAYDLKIKDNSLLFVNRYDNKVYSLSL
ncbi:MAG: hypothetical protein M1155_00220 [Patescibacteria group bacterium]|nr:hypothetical protein [Patescibacteria group bacterium]